MFPRLQAPGCFRPIAVVATLCHFRFMRWLPLLSAVATLCGCAGPKNTFLVDDPRGLVTTATLRLCGSVSPLERNGDRLSLQQSVACEGDGEIQLVYRDGGQENCIVGYVTPDAKQDFRFRAKQSSCQPFA